MSTVTNPKTYSTMKTRTISLRLILVGSVAALFVGQSADATPYNWIGATSGTWNTTTNWSGGVVPSITDDLTILGPLNVAGALTISFNTDNSANSLNFTNTAATTLSAVGGRSLTLGAGGITTGAGAVQIGANSANAINITLNAAQTWNVGAGGLTVTNFVGGSALTKTGAGNLLFNTGAGNGFTGGLNVNGGTVTLDFVNLATPTNLIAATNALQINNAALTITGRNVAAATTAQTFAGTTLGAGRNTVNIAKGASATSATLNLGALTANSGSVTTFSPTTAWTTTASSTERVFLTAGGSVPTLPAGANTAFVTAGVFHRVAAGAVGTLRLAAVNSSGQLLLKGNAGNLAAGTGVDPTNTYQLSAGAIALTNTGASIYGLLLNATGAGTNITVANSGTLTLNSVIQIKATESVSIVPGTGVSNVVIGSEKNLVIAMDNAAAFGISAPIVDNGGGASGVTIVGTAPTGTPGAVTLSGANTFTGPTNIHNNLVAFNNASALGGNNPGVNGTSAINMTNGATLRTNVTNGGFNLYAPITTSGNVTINTPSVSNGAQTFNELIVRGAIGGTGNVTFSNVFNANTIPTVTLNAQSTYSGTTTLDNTGGTAGQAFIKLGIDNALPTTTVLNINGAAGTGTGRGIGLNLFGFNQTLAGLTNTTGLSLRTQQVVNSDASAAATLTINGSTNTTFSGNLGTNFATFSVSSSAVTGSTNGNNFGVTKNGTGTFTLSAANTYSGATKISGGILSLGIASAMSQSPLDTLNSVTGDASNGLRTTVTTLTMGGLTGNKNLANVFTTTSGGYNTVTALTLNPVTGATHSYSGDIGNGSMTVTKTGAGTQVLSGTNTYTGTTAINAGTLRLDFSAAGAASNIISTSSALSMGGGTLALQGKASTTNSQQVNGLSVSGGVASSVQLTADPTANPLLLTLGAITRTAGSTVDFTLPAGTQDATNGITTSTPNFAGSNILGHWATVGGTAFATNNGTNIVAVTQTLTSVAGTTAANYTNIDIDVDNSAGLLDGPIAISSLRFNTAAATTVTLAAGNNVIASGGILVNSAVGNNLSTITGGTLQGAASADLAVIQNNAASSLLIGSDIADNTGATALTKIGAGTLILSGANTYTGGTTLATGTLRFANTNAMPAVGIVAAATGTTLAVNVGGAGEFTGATSGNGSIGGLLAGLGGQAGGTVTYAGTATLGLDTTNVGGTLAYSGAIANVGTTLRINKLGTGTLSLSAVNTYTGGTTISEGILQVGGAGTLTAAGAISIATGATLQYSSSAAQTLSGAITGAGGLTKDTNNSDLTLSNVGNTYSGTTTVSAGRIIATAATHLSSGAASIVQTGTGTLFINAAVTISNPFNISSLGFPETSAGTDSQNNFDGGIRLNGSTLMGTITLSGNSRISAFANTTNTISGQITGGFGIDFYGFQNTASHAETFVLSNPANNYTGTTTIFNSNYNTTNLAGVLTTLKLGASNVIPDGASAGNVAFAINGTNDNATTILDLNGFSETINGLTVNAGTFAARITNSVAGASVLQIGANDTTSAFSGTITNTTGTLAITKIGAGTLTLSGLNTYTGATTVSAGTLLVNGSISGSTTTVNSGGTLGGSGGTTGDVTVATGGTIAPGSSIGTLNTGALAFTGGAFGLELNTTAITSDLANVTGNLSLLGGATLNISDFNVSSTPLSIGQVFTFIDYSGTWDTGVFAGYADDSRFTLGLNEYRISYDGVNNATSAVTLEVVPEPGSAVLLLGGIAALAGFRRRRRVVEGCMNLG